MSFASPEGLLIGRNPRKPTWRVGRQLGEGVCGTVHELVSSSETTPISSSNHSQSSLSWAIKMAPLTSQTKITKKKQAELTHHANLLHMEKLLYTAHLNKLRGNIIPHVPTSIQGPPDFGEVEGFRYLVMERMKAPLAHVIDLLMKELPSSTSTKSHTISFGPIAARLVQMVQSIHEHHLLVVDVKPENFMLASSSPPKKKATKKSSLSDSIRLIDLGLLQDRRKAGGLRPNVGTSGIVGTPLYASLNLHNGQTPSARDDMEAIGYVVVELLLGLLQAVQKQNKAVSSSLSLPWSHATSDEEIHQSKQQSVEGPNFFLGLFSKSQKYVGKENAHLEDSLQEYFASVRGLDYSSQPDYEALSDLLSQLDVVVPSSPAKKRATTKATKTPPRRATSANETKTPPRRAAPPPADATPRRSTRRSAAAKRPSPQKHPANEEDASFDYDEDAPLPPSPKYRRRGAPSPAGQTEDDPDLSFEFVEARDGEETELSFETCQEGPESMEWESIVEQDENKRPKLGLGLLFLNGPHQDETLALVQGAAETLVLGRNPTAKQARAVPEDTFVVKDNNVADRHTKLVLCATKRLQTIQVVDLKSSTGTFVNGTQIPKGKDCKAFRNDTIQIGEIKLKVTAYNPKVESSSSSSRGPPVQDRKRAASQTVSDDVVMVDSPASNDEEIVRGPSLKIDFIQGPHKNESIVLSQGIAEKLTLGSNPTAKSGETHTLSGDGVAPNHVRLELVVKKKAQLATIVLFDLKSTEGTLVNSDRVPAGKDRKVFHSDRITIGPNVMVVKRA